MAIELDSLIPRLASLNPKAFKDTLLSIVGAGDTGNGTPRQRRKRRTPAQMAKARAAKKKRA